MKSVLMSDAAWTEYQKRESIHCNKYGTAALDPVDYNELNELLDEVAGAILLSDPKAMWDGGTFGYVPMNGTLTKWKSTDGGELDVSLLDIMMFYTDDLEWLVDLINCRDMDSVVSKHVQERVANQETYESKKLSADL